ncbi:DNA N-glycosylase and apurinic/apyrimidinic (AP) lyase [Quaeritorhiza haematococci]|nr:DNA N-glycosylase and apurinic/apyrimidinic (AP) lyase [Quaeritorhiza haematococci]
MHRTLRSGRQLLPAVESTRGRRGRINNPAPTIQPVAALSTNTQTNTQDSEPVTGTPTRNATSRKRKSLTPTKPTPNSNTASPSTETPTPKSGKPRIKRPKERTRCKTPERWQDVYNGIKAFREKNQAPVDTMGCERLGDLSQEPKVFRYQTLVALQLSSQTKDPITADAVKKLMAHKPGGLTVDSILEMDEKTLDGYIAKVGFHNRKTKYLKDTAKILKEKYDGDIPPTVEALQELPGIGPKMAYLCMQCAWNK